MGLHSYRLVRAALLSTIESAYNGNMLIRTGPWSNGRRLPLSTWERDGSRCTMGGRQASRGSVMLLTMFCWKTLDPGFHLYATFDMYYLPKDCCRPRTSLHWWQWPVLGRIMHFTTLQKLFRNGLRNITKSSKCCLGFQIAQISIQLSIYGMCWMSKSDPWKRHLTTCRT